MTHHRPLVIYNVVFANGETPLSAVRGGVGGNEDVVIECQKARLIINEFTVHAEFSIRSQIHREVRLGANVTFEYLFRVRFGEY